MSILNYIEVKEMDFVNGYFDVGMVLNVLLVFILFCDLERIW